MAWPLLLSTIKPVTRYRDECDLPSIMRETRHAWRLILRSKHWSEIHRSLQNAIGAYTPQKPADILADTISASCDGIRNLEELCESVLPWRVGPYQLGSLFVDTEWQSFRKWSRIAPLLPHRPNMRVADVGCSNGYFLFKMSQLSPEIAIGFDPIERCWLQFAFLLKLLGIPNTAFLPVGLLSLKAFPRFFDLIVCMGVLYHQRDHRAAIQQLFDSTRPGGSVVLESLVVPQEESLPITAPDRYAKMRNAWIMPSPSSIKRLFQEVGFTNVELRTFGALGTDEQRRTKLSPYESLVDFLDPNDPSKTVEGHPAPHTAAVVGTRPY